MESANGCERDVYIVRRQQNEQRNCFHFFRYALFVSLAGILWGIFCLLLLLRVVFDPFTVRRVNSWWQTIWKVDILRHFCVQFVNWIFKPSVLMKREIFPIFLFLLFRIESASLFVCSLCSTHCSSFRDGRIYIPSLKLIRQLHFGLLSVLLPFFTPETKINLPIQETR